MIRDIRIYTFHSGQLERLLSKEHKYESTIDALDFIENQSRTWHADRQLILVEYTGPHDCEIIKVLPRLSKAKTKFLT